MPIQKFDLSTHTISFLDEGDGDPILMLHGFPDSNKLWRNQIPALVDAGYRVIAPDLRGFGESGRPLDSTLYAPEYLFGDMVGLLDQLELDRVKLVAHDWGAFVGWIICLLAPERIERYVSLSVGHPASYFSSGIAQKQASWYMLLFQLEGVEEYIRANDWQFFRDFVQHHPELDTWLADLDRPDALRAGLNWYRANGNPLQAFDVDSLPACVVPVTGLWGSGDIYLTEAQMLGTPSYMNAPWQYHRVEGAGHWLQLDRPDVVNKLLLDSFAE